MKMTRLEARCGREWSVVAAVPIARPDTRPGRLGLPLLLAGADTGRWSLWRRSAAFVAVERQLRATSHVSHNFPYTVIRSPITGYRQ